jgi:uncharacterized protein YdeI (YjbR/CyaY-like superfamily)
MTVLEPPENSIHPRSLDEWRSWLERNHERTDGVWLITHTRASGRSRLEYEGTVEVALAYGWIDGKAAKLDSERSMLWFSPRRKGSGWSRSNKLRVERLLSEGRMQPAGLARVEAAKADGSWSFLDSSEALEVPDDLAAALGEYPRAAENFKAFPPSARKAILAWIETAKRAETRARRVEQTARLAAENQRANQ